MLIKCQVDTSRIFLSFHIFSCNATEKQMALFFSSFLLFNVKMATTNSPNILMELKTRRQQFQTQTSTLDTRRRQAVCVRRAFKKYGSKSNPNIILDGLNMTVPKGTMWVIGITSSLILTIGDDVQKQYDNPTIAALHTVMDCSARAAVVRLPCCHASSAAGV